MRVGRRDLMRIAAHERLASTADRLEVFRARGTRAESPLSGRGTKSRSSLFSPSPRVAFERTDIAQQHAILNGL